MPPMQQSCPTHALSRQRASVVVGLPSSPHAYTGKCSSVAKGAEVTSLGRDEFLWKGALEPITAPDEASSGRVDGSGTVRSTLSRCAPAVYLLLTAPV